jgi:tRNA A37 threonylcarbamoyltransferase TsaD
LIPPQSLATDNAAMIGIAGWQKFAAQGGDPLSFGPQPDLRLRFSALA